MRISDWSSDVCSSDLFIASMQRLIDALALDVELNNPYRHMTKGEMVANCADKPFLEKIVANSMSCSSPAKARYKKLSPRHCGYCVPCLIRRARSEEHTSELQSLMRISYAVFCLKKKNNKQTKLIQYKINVT